MGHLMVSRIEDLNITNVHINTVAKTASSSFIYSIKNKYPNKYPNIHHGHSLLDLKNVVEKCDNTLIISGIRNPLERNVSYFFQTFPHNYNNDVKTAANEYKGENCYVMSVEELLKSSTLELISAFINQKNHFTFNEWFYEFFYITNVIDIEFDKKNGIKIYNLPNNNHLMLYTFESLDRNELFIKSFFGINKFIHSNNSSERPYDKKYRAFKRILTLDHEYKSRLLRTPIMKYFYSDEDIDEFFRQF